MTRYLIHNIHIIHNENKNQNQSQGSNLISTDFEIKISHKANIYENSQI